MSQATRAFVLGVGIQVVIALVLLALHRISVAFGTNIVLTTLLALAAGIGLHRLLAQGDETSGGSVRFETAALYALLLVSVALAEEGIWRGFVLATLEVSRGMIVALLVSTLGFAAAHALHQGWSGVRFHVLTGSAFGLAMLLSGSVLVAAVMHVAYNLSFLTALVRKRGLADGTFSTP